jgi:hypothetical protein
MIKKISNRLIIDDYGLREMGSNKKPTNYKKIPLKHIEKQELLNARTYVKDMEKEGLSTKKGKNLVPHEIGSYELKHLAEDHLRSTSLRNNQSMAYVSNGSLIYAMEEKGYEFHKRENGDINVSFIIYLKKKKD